jgi:hypothetical protein
VKRLKVCLVLVFLFLFCVFDAHCFYISGTVKQKKGSDDCFLLTPIIRLDEDSTIESFTASVIFDKEVVSYGGGITIEECEKFKGHSKNFKTNKVRAEDKVIIRCEDLNVFFHKNEEVRLFNLKFKTNGSGDRARFFVSISEINGRSICDPGSCEFDFIVNLTNLNIISPQVLPKAETAEFDIDESTNARVVENGSFSNSGNLIQETQELVEISSSELKKVSSKEFVDADVSVKSTAADQLDSADNDKRDVQTESDCSNGPLFLAEREANTDVKISKIVAIDVGIQTDAEKKQQKFKSSTKNPTKKKKKTNMRDKKTQTLKTPKKRQKTVNSRVNRRKTSKTQDKAKDVYRKSLKAPKKQQTGLVRTKSCFPRKQTRIKAKLKPKKIKSKATKTTEKKSSRGCDTLKKGKKKQGKINKENIKKKSPRVKTSNCNTSFKDYELDFIPEHSTKERPPIEITQGIGANGFAVVSVLFSLISTILFSIRLPIF